MFKGEAVSAEHTLKVTKKGFKPGKISVASGDEKVSAKLDAGGGAGAPGPVPQRGNGGPKQPADYKPSPY
jgi:hypothetical protein